MKKYIFLEKILILINILAITSGLVYRVYKLNIVGIAISLILAISLYIIILFWQKHKQNECKNFSETLNEKHTKTNIVLVILYFIFLFIAVFILLESSTFKSIISPWEVISGNFFFFWFLSTLVYLYLSQNNKYYWLSHFHYFFSFSIALIVYKIGYGFDPFIHQSTIELIDKIGSVQPKQFYYLGQYGLEMMLHNILWLPIKTIDKFLVPFFAALFIPFLIKKINFEYRNFLLPLFLIIPFSIFILTTPQNLAYLWLIISIFYTIHRENKNDQIIAYSSAFASLITQPIAGLAAVFFIIFCEVSLLKKYKKIKWFFLFLFTILTPLLLFLTTSHGLNLNSSYSLWQEITTNFPWPTWTGQSNWLLNLVYLFGFNIGWLVLIFGLIGWKLSNHSRQNYSVYFSFSAWLSYLIMKLLPYSFLIDYERDDYANRLLIVAAIFLLPSIAETFKFFTNKLQLQTKITKFLWLFFISLLITFSLYVSYPRVDDYFNSRGYSVGSNEIEAVHWISDDTKKTYIVLANQQVSVAALHEFGFNHYYKNNIFYYPIPTGGPLYQFYLKMVYEKPTRENMLAAMDLAGVDEGYFVLNKYWWAFAKILDEAKLTADSYKIINNGEIYIFKYSR